MPGLTTRIVVGISILALLALWDWRKNRGRATRWREYLVLLVCAGAALIYGAVNDQVTTTISWEYFAYGKGVAERTSSNEPLNSPRFRWEAAKIGMQAAWAPGLLIGVALLVANNPRRTLPRLPYLRLVRDIPLVLMVTAITSALLGVLGYFGAFTSLNADFRDMLRLNQWRPRRFMAVFGVHLGAYVGGAIGAVVAVVRVLRARYNLAHERTADR